MKKEHLTFQEANEAFLNIVKGLNVVPEQPSRDLSKLQGSTWHLRNVRGTLARVNRHGEVWIKMMERQT